jgi:regulator of protease activity HflC (stomatin/prohibitin superfamily)
MQMNQEKVISAPSGYLMFFISLSLMAFSIFTISAKVLPIYVGIILIIFALFILNGFVAIEPNSSRVLTLFGDYKGTIQKSGFFWINPFYNKKKISLRANNLETTQLKVNDKQGNPIIIGAVVVWKVSDTYKAAFDVENYNQFVNIQAESALRKLAMQYSYDNFEDENAEITLRSSSSEINNMLEHEISDRLQIAGIQVVEARISHLAYAQEIASAMLQRQQATAVVAARAKIVEGAVGMVEMALDQLSKKEIVDLDEEKKAAMVSNLLVVLCADKSAAPVVNTGTLYN